MGFIFKQTKKLQISLKLLFIAYTKKIFNNLLVDFYKFLMFFEGINTS